MDEDLAAEIREFRSPTDNETRMFYEIIIAPGYTPEGLAKLKGKSKTLRILEAPLRAPSGRSLRQIAGEGPHLTAVTSWGHDPCFIRLCPCMVVGVQIRILWHSSIMNLTAPARQKPHISVQVGGCTSTRTR